MSSAKPTPRLTIAEIRALKGERPICCLTAYDYPGALVCARAGIELILVGDSLGNVVQGRPDTLGVTLEQMVYHTGLVARALDEAALRGELERLPLLVTDMPFLTFHTTPERAVENAGRLLAEGGAQAVKIESRPGIAEYVERLTRVGVPVMGHLGLTPQAVHQLGGFRVQGRDADAAREMIEQARRLEEAGAFAIVLELIPAELAAEISAAVGVPTIGIGAGAAVDGQILVFHDLLGFPGALKPRHVKRYLDADSLMTEAVAEYAAEVLRGDFPGPEHGFQ